MYVFFLGLIPQGIHPSQHRTALPSVIASGLSQAREEGSQEIRRLLADRMRTQAISKPSGEGLSPSFSTAPRVLPCELIPGDQSLS